jgi:hypothetical protein
MGPVRHGGSATLAEARSRGVEANESTLGARESNTITALIPRSSASGAKLAARTVTIVD